MADSEIQQPVDSTQQVTSKMPAAIQKKSKTCCRRQSYRPENKACPRGAKKAFAEAQIIIANNQLKQAASASPAADPPSAVPDPSAAAADSRQISHPLTQQPKTFLQRLNG